MATNTQAAVELQLAPSGYALQGGLYVPKAGAQGFAQPMGVGYGSDGTAGFSMMAPANAVAEFSAGTQVKTGIYPSGTATGQTLTIAAPGAGLGIWIAGLILNVQVGTGAQLAGVSMTHFLGGQSWQASSTTTTPGMVLWTPAAAWPEDTANTAIVITTTMVPGTSVAGIVVSVYYLIRPAVG